MEHELRGGSGMQVQSFGGLGALVSALGQKGLAERLRYPHLRRLSVVANAAAESMATLAAIFAEARRTEERRLVLNIHAIVVRKAA